MKNNIISLKDKTRFFENTAHRAILIEEGRYAIPTHKVHKNKKAYDRNTFKYALCILVILFSINGFSQSPARNIHVPCDCMDTAQTTMSMMDCAIKSYDKADKELNTQYKLLMNILDDKAKTDFKICQLSWIKERDLTFKAFETIYSDGSLNRVNAMLLKTEFVLRRSDFLYNLRFDLLEDRN